MGGVYFACGTDAKQLKAPRRESPQVHQDAFEFTGVTESLLGASWEGFMIEKSLHWVGDRSCNCWATQSRAELEPSLPGGGDRHGVETKYAGAPCVTKSPHIVLQDLGLRQLFVVYPGDEAQASGKKISALMPDHIRAQRTSGKHAAVTSWQSLE
jgi:hypothetical protein